MIKNIFIILILVFGFSFSEVSHSGLTGTNIHTVYRWQFADSAARVSQSVSAADTMKLAYQRSDSTSWILVSTTGTKWKKVAYASNQNTLTTSTMTLDSLKLTKGINATGGTFSGRLTATDVQVSDSVRGVSGAFTGRVTGTDIDVSDSVKGVTGNYTSTVTAKDVNITDLTSGYIPYKSTNLENSNIFTDGKNTAIGKASIEDWQSGYKALHIGGNTAIFAPSTELGESSTWILSNTYNDGAWKPYASGSAACIRFGSTGFIYSYDTGVVADVGFTQTSRFSWTLANGMKVTNKIVSYDSIKGTEAAFSGRITGTDLQVSDSVKAVSGAFSGRITGTDIDVSDSVKGVTGTFSGALTGTTLNTGNGANELYAMDQNVRSTDSINGLIFNSTRVRTNYFLNDSIRNGKIHTLGISGITSPIALTGLHIMNNLSTGKLTSGSGIGSVYTYNDNTALELSAGTTSGFQSGIVVGARSYSGTNTDGLYFYTRSAERFKIDGNGAGTFNGALSSTTLNTGLGNNELHPMDQAVLTTSPVTFTTVNTGNGANELYPMNQAVMTTSDVTFDSTRTRVSVFDSVKLGTGSYLKNYVEGTFPCTLKTSDVTVQQIGTAYYTKIGNVLTMSFPELSGTSNSGSLVIYCVMPFAPKQQLAGYGYDKTSVTVTDNGSTLNARAAVSWNPTIINRIIFNIIPTATFTSSGTKGISPFTIRYITE